MAYIGWKTTKCSQFAFAVIHSPTGQKCNVTTALQIYRKRHFDSNLVLARMNILFQEKAQIKKCTWVKSIPHEIATNQFGTSVNANCAEYFIMSLLSSDQNADF